LELARRHVVGTLIALAAIATTATAVALRGGGRSDRVTGHAFAIPSADARIVVEVLNGTGRPGRKTKLVVRRGGDQAAARRVAQALGGGAVVVDLDTLRRVDVSVILGEDWKAPDDAGL
jgi:S1-C subfamily serine protease